MIWKHETRDGRPVWAGINSVYDMQRKSREGVQLAALGVGVVLFIVGAVLMGANLLLGVVVMIAGPILAVVLINAQKTEDFITSKWRLDVSPDGLLIYQGPQSWTVALADVAGVETGRTVDWEPVRQFGAHWGDLNNPTGSHEVPKNEFQTFLHMGDATRRVILTANSEREQCAALAASLRGALEALKTGPASAPAPAGEPSPATPEKGFSL